MASGEKSSMSGLVVVGSYNTDLIIWCDRIPSRGEILMGGNSEMYCGGRGANCAVAAARAGCEAGAAECLVAWASITLAMTGDLAHAARAGAEAMAFSLSRPGALDSLPYRSELPSY
jgi:sugar/nucleoside kinase (ribokinase family)